MSQALVYLGALLLLAGCYDAKALQQSRREMAQVARWEELDLGDFRVMLPHMPGHSGGGVVEFHVFGQVTRKDKGEVAEALASRGPALRSRMLLSIRSLSGEQLLEPKLSTLRERIAGVVNGALEKELVHNVGFYSFKFSAM